MVLKRDLLRAQMFLHRQGVVRAALHCRIVRNDHAFGPADTTYSRDDPCTRRFIVVHAVGCQGTDLQEGRARVEQRLDTLTREELASGEVPVSRTGRSAFADSRELES